MSPDVFEIARQKRQRREAEKARDAEKEEAFQQKRRAFITRFHEYLLSLNGQNGVTAKLRTDAALDSAYVLLFVDVVSLGMSYTNFEFWDNSTLRSNGEPTRYVAFGLRDLGGAGHDHSLAEARFLFDDLDRPGDVNVAFAAFIDRLADLLVDHIQP